MTANGSETNAAARLVLDRLGRPPQDELEAAVVLECWGSYTPPRSLELGAIVAATTGLSGATDEEAFRFHRPLADRGTELLSIALAAIAATLLLAPLARDVDEGTLERAWSIAVPTSLGFVWALARPGGRFTLEAVRPSKPYVVPRAVAGAGSIATWALGSVGLVGGLLVLVYAGGLVLGRLGCGWPYIAALVVSGGAATAGAPALAALAVTSILGVGQVTYALHRMAPARHPLGSLPIFLRTAAPGVGLGLLLVSDREVGRFMGITELLFFLPAVVGFAWATLHVAGRRRTLAGSELASTWEGSAHQTYPLGVLAGSLMRQVGATVVLSAPAVWLRWASGRHLLAIGAFVTAALVVALLYILGHRAFATTSVLVVVGISIVVGVDLLASSTALLLVVLPAAVVLLHGRDRSTATLLIR